MLFAACFSFAGCVFKLTQRVADTLKACHRSDTTMTHRSRSSKDAPNAQKMRNPKSSRPRHVPTDAGLSYGTSLPLEQESLFPGRNYALSSTLPAFSSQGHVRESPWNFSGYGDPPEGDVSFTFSGTHGEYSPCYTTSMEENKQYPPSYTSSMGSPALRSNTLPWTSSNVDSSLYASMTCDFDMLSGNALLQSSPGLFVPLSAEVDLLPHQSSHAIYSAPAFLPSGSYCHGNLSEGEPAVPNPAYAFQRTAAEGSSQTWTHSHQFPGITQQMPLTPPASDHGTPPSTQECSSLSSQDPGQDTYDQQGGLRSQERPSLCNFGEYFDDVYPSDTTGWNQVQRLAHLHCTAGREVANLAQH